MRGVRSLYLPYFCEPTPEPEGRGRSDFLIQRRDRKLVCRYYFHTYFKRLNFEQTIEQLSLEFDIAERTITDRLQMNNELIDILMNKKPPVFEFKREFPFFVWS